jgi:Kef-type K+ transport system membrane component KefB
VHDLAFLLLGGAAAGIVGRATRLPLTPLYLVAGVVLAVTGGVHGSIVAGGGGDLTLLLILGASLLLFIAGTELIPARAGRRRAAAVRVGVGQFAVLGALGGGAAVALGFGVAAAGYLALALAASSTLVGVRILHGRREFHEPVGRLVVGVLLLQDALVILMFPVLAAALEGWQASAVAAAATLALGLLTLALARWVAPRMARGGATDLEGRTLLALALLSVFVALAAALGLPAITGAFLAGVSLAALPVAGTLRAALVPLTDFGRALFFTALGAAIPLPSLAELGQAVVLTTLILAVTPPLVAGLAESNGYSARTGILAGLVLAQTSELSLVLTLQGVVDGVLSPSVFAVVSLVTLLTMGLTPFLASDRVVFALLRLHPRLHRIPPVVVPDDHVVLLGCGTNGSALLDLLLLGGREVVVVEQDPAIADDLRGAGIRVIHGDAGAEKVLALARPETARVVLSTLRHVADTAPVLRRVGGRVPVLVRVFEPAEAAWVAREGGTPIDFSEATADEFLRWWREKGAAACSGFG